MHHDRQHVLVRADHEQRHADQRPGAGQIEDLVRRLAQRRHQVMGLGDLQLQAGFLESQDALVGLSPDVREHRPQSLMPVQDIIHGGGHRLAVQRPAQT
jgi:hypothetical protein